MEDNSNAQRNQSSGSDDINDSGLPVALYLESARPHEVKLVQQTIASRFETMLPKRLIGDKAYASDPLARSLTAQGTLYDRTAPAFT